MPKGSTLPSHQNKHPIRGLQTSKRISMWKKNTRTGTKSSSVQWNSRYPKNSQTPAQQYYQKRKQKPWKDLNKKQNKDMTILPADNGRTTVITHTEKYEKQMKGMLKHFSRNSQKGSNRRREEEEARGASETMTKWKQNGKADVQPANTHSRRTFPECPAHWKYFFLNEPRVSLPLLPLSATRGIEFRFWCCIGSAVCCY